MAVITAVVKGFFNGFLPVPQWLFLLKKNKKGYESKHQMFPGLWVICGPYVPKLERVLERSMMACLLGLFRTERLAREMSAVTRVMDILQRGTRSMLGTAQKDKHVLRHVNTRKTREANSGRESEG